MSLVAKENLGFYIRTFDSKVEFPEGYRNHIPQCGICERIDSAKTREEDECNFWWPNHLTFEVHQKCHELVRKAFAGLQAHLDKKFSCSSGGGQKDLQLSNRFRLIAIRAVKKEIGAQTIEGYFREKGKRALENLFNKVGKSAADQCFQSLQQIESNN